MRLVVFRFYKVLRAKKAPHQPFAPHCIPHFNNQKRLPVDVNRNKCYYESRALDGHKTQNGAKR